MLGSGDLNLELRRVAWHLDRAAEHVANGDRESAEITLSDAKSLLRFECREAAGLGSDV